MGALPDLYCGYQKVALTRQKFEKAWSTTLPDKLGLTALEMLEKRKRYVDAVVVTGGEPCMHKELPKFLAKLKERGFSVKLDTNGFFPEVLEECLASVDYVAMDLKTDPARYGETVAPGCDAGTLRASVEAVMRSGLAYEFRTTCVRPLVTRLCDRDPMPVIVQTDKTTPAGLLMRVVDEAKLGKAKNVSIATEQGS